MTNQFLLETQQLSQSLRTPPPDSTPNSELEILDWTPPPWLAQIYATHSGIGPWWPNIGWGRPTLLPWSEVRPLTAWIRFGEENITFDPADCVLLTPNTSGGGIVLCERTAPILRHFDGQTHRLGALLTPKAYLKGLVAEWRLQA